MAEDEHAFPERLGRGQFAAEPFDLPRRHHPIARVIAIGHHEAPPLCRRRGEVVVEALQLQFPRHEIAAGRQAVVAHHVVQRRRHPLQYRQDPQGVHLRGLRLVLPMPVIQVPAVHHEGQRLRIESPHGRGQDLQRPPVLPFAHSLLVPVLDIGHRAKRE